MGWSVGRYRVYHIAGTPQTTHPSTNYRRGGRTAAGRQASLADTRYSPAASLVSRIVVSGADLGLMFLGFDGVGKFARNGALFLLLLGCDPHSLGAGGYSDILQPNQGVKLDQ